VVDGTRPCWYGNISRLAVNAAGRPMPGMATVLAAAERRFGAEGNDVMVW